MRYVYLSLIGTWVLVGCSQPMHTRQNILESSSTATQQFDGKVLYANTCAGCHNSLAASNILDRTAAQINAARLGVGIMKSNAAVQALTQAQVEALAQALSTGAGGTNPYTQLCQSNPRPTGTRLQRLAKSEYMNSIRDLFMGVVSLTEISTELAQVPEEVNADNPFDRGADSLNLGLVRAQDAVARKVASLVAASSTKLNQVFSETCFTQASVTDACLNSFFDRFGLMVYRRPVKAAERTPLIAAYRLGTSRAESSEFLLRALLMSPNFLYHIEFDGTAVDATTFRLSAYELASRLSYLVTNSTPDSALLSAAANGSLLTDATFTSQMNRLLGLPSARASLRRFFYTWFELGRIPDATYSAAFRADIATAGLNAEATEESLQFVDHVLFGGKSLGSLLTDTTAFVKSADIAKIYGIPLPTTADGRTTLPAAQRAGLLTRVAYILAGEDGTSPIHRGVSIRRSLLCDTIASPDPTTLPAGSLDAPPDDPLLSTRQRFERKTSPAACMACHSNINNFGYALEIYDGLGRHRFKERILDSSGNVVAEHPVDARATIGVGITPEPHVDGAIELSQTIASSSKYLSCFSKRWFQFNIRRSSSNSDACYLAATVDALKQPGATLLDVIRATITHPEFKLKRTN